MVAQKIMKTGAEGQLTHHENGISRSWRNDSDWSDGNMNQIPWVVR
jgi:hypothetical protein